MNANLEQDGKATQFAPGQSGNLNGRPRTKPMTDALKSMMDKDDGKAITVLLERAYTEAAAGDFRYFKEIMDRVDGKTIEAVDIMSDGQGISTTPGLSAEDHVAINKLKGGPGEG